MGSLSKLYLGNVPYLSACTALEKLKATLPYAITDGLFRVDIFQTLSGQLVVNEFESLEADFGCRISGAIDFGALAWTFVSNFWRLKMESLIVV
jgi:hypothetical protein